MGFKERVALVYHEMAHCVCNKGHLNEIMPNGCHKSLLNKSLLNVGCLTYNFEYYLDEIKKGCDE